MCEHSLFLMTEGEYQISLGICLQRVQDQDPKDVRFFHRSMDELDFHSP